MTEEKTHALLSASSADKWLHCTPSARMEQMFPDASGESAAEGTLAHELGELKLRLYFGHIQKAAYTKEFNKIKKNELYAKDIDNYTEDYLEYIKSVEISLANKPYAVFEMRVDYSKYAPEGFGTVDCMLISGNEVHVIDFKYGKTVFVPVEDNPQLKLYALGVIERYGSLFPVDKVTLHIVQPRKDNMSKWSITIKDLLAWSESIKPIADTAFKGEGECSVGDWCDSHFCRCRASCRAYMNQMNAVKPYIDKEPKLLSNDEIGHALTLAANIKKWYSLLEAHAQGLILAGENVDGWKIVEGRSNRTFGDIDTAYKVLVQSGIDEAVLYNRTPITLTDCEKLLGKKDFSAQLSSYITKPAGKPTLVPQTDPREPFNPAASDFEGLETNN
ncbi:MAG: DUF2800 domain-containing protein [Candidatus Metalachnospira sp.]|nr:DUF2800 domain-containing protein [Candidatus Metalachnospira sp.]